MSQIDRRAFIKFCGSLVGLSLFGGIFNLLARPTILAKENATHNQGSNVDLSNVHGPSSGITSYGMVIDVGACIGCRRCAYACKEENNIPDTISPPWIEIFEMKSGLDVTSQPSVDDLQDGATTSYEKSPTKGSWYMPVQCYHCDDPPCVKVCPTGATYKDETDGIVLMDYDRCVGCRFCVVACPYSARRFNWSKPELDEDLVNPQVPLRKVGVAEKCTFCVHRVRKGRLPACVVACPVSARHFGKQDDPDSEISRILEANHSFRLLHETNTYPNIWYITRGKKWYNED